LTAHRTADIQAAMANRPEVALAALVHRLALQVFSNGYVSNRLVQINIEQPYLKPDAENIRKLPRQVDNSEVEHFPASNCSRNTAGGRLPSASWGRSSL
jgi:hypothetical protein